MFSITLNFRNLRPVIAVKVATSLFLNIPSWREASTAQQSRIRNTSLFTRRTGAAETSSRPLFLHSSVLTILIILLAMTGMAYAATSIPFTINTSEAVNVTGTPRIAIDVGGVTRYAMYTSGSGTSALTFTYTMTAGDVDLDGVTLSSPIDLNGGTLKDLNGNDASLTFTPPNTSNVKVNYPSLGMDFIYDADGRYTLNGTVYNDLTSFLTASGGTFSRSSIGTYFNSSGTLQTASSNVPRFDFDPITHTAKGILIEESRSNLVFPSNPNTWGMGPGGTLTQNAAASPDNLISATQIAWSASPNVFAYSNTITPALNTTYTASFFIKDNGSNSATKLCIAAGGTDGSHQFRLSFYPALLPAGAFSTSVTSSSDATVSSYLVQQLSNGWNRVSVAGTWKTTYAVAFGYYACGGTSGNTYVWGAQLEQGEYASSYIPTTTVAVTRAAETLSIPTSGWINSVEGTLYADGEYGGIGTARSMAYLGSSFASNFQPTKEGDLAFRIYLNGSQIFQDLAINAFSNNKVAFGLKSGQYAYVKNGGTVSTSANAAIATNQNTLVSDGGFYHTKKIKFYPARISNNQLQLLTQ